jgi:hypothetical protein
VTDFRTDKEAKDYLAGRIAAQAKQENVPLSEVERKMLYWSETDWTLPDMKVVGVEFEREYSDVDYERKIATLIADLTADRHHQNESEEEKWDAAVYKLRDGDHYIQVLLSEARRKPHSLAGIRFGGFIPTSDAPEDRPPNDSLKLVIMAVVVSFVFIFVLIAWSTLRGRLLGR